MSEQPTDYASELARVQAESEGLKAECELLRIEAARLRSLTQKLRAQLAVAEAERDKLRGYTASIERSRPWRAVQAVRGLLGRRW